MEPWDSKMKPGEICNPENCSPHVCLKEVEITGYSGLTNEDELIIYLIKTAASMEKIIVNPCKSLEWPFTVRTKTLKTKKKEKKARRHAKKHMGKMIPKTIEFICL